MPERRVVRAIDRYFRHLGPRAQVVLCQLPLAVIILILVLTVPAVGPELFSNNLFLAGLFLHAVLFLCCLFIPWETLPRQASLAIPMLDLVAIGFTRNGAVEIIPGLGVLAIFPVIWLSGSGMLPKTVLLVSFFGPLFIVLPPVLARYPDVPAGDLTATVFLPLMLLAVALSTRFASVNMRLQQRSLEEKDVKLRALLQASNSRERLLQTILDTIDVGIVAVNGDGEQVLANHKQKAFRGLDGSRGQPEAGNALELQVLGQDKKSVLPPERHPVQRAIEGETFADYLVWVGDAIEQRALSTAARSMRDERGEFTGAVVVFNDVTGLVEAITAKDDFVSNVSHEFRTPLTSILGNLDLVLDGEKLSPRASNRLDIARRNAERLQALVADLLVSTSTGMSVHPRRTDLSGLIETSVGSARAHADGAGIDLVVDVPVPLWTYADPLRMGQVLDNLVSNAIKYSPDGGVVTVRAHNDDRWVWLRVEDTGMGMTETDAAKVFTRFFRSGAAHQAAIPGVGLGLSITKTIVESHGGAISCVSKPGRGTTFMVTLPAGDTAGSN